MKNILFGFILILFSFAAIRAQTVAFVGVNVIPMDKERVLENQTVLVRDGIIAEIGKKVKIPAGAQIIDAKGKYLIPGLVDMHTHMLSDDDAYPDSIAGDELRVMIANGVTTIRFMIGTPEQLILRAKSANGEIIAPTIYSASPHLTGREQGNDFVVNTAEEAREAVRKSKQAGYDFIKVTTFIKAEVYEAAVDEAAKQNIRVIGHADSRFVGLDRALKARQQIEHLDGYLEAVLADNAPMKGSVSDLYIYNPKNWESLDYVDEKKIAEVAKRTVASNPFVDPTQHFMKNTFGLPRSEESIRAQPDFRFYPKQVQDFYINYLKRTKLNEVPLEKRAKWISIRDKIIKAIYDAGGKIMTGSDTPEFLWLYGFSLHREMKALQDAGLSNYAVLEAATKNPSEYLGTLDKVGTIEKGKRADLVLLDANPLENISNTEKRSGVMLKGKYYAQGEMNKWLDEIAPRISSSYIEKLTPQQEAAVVADRLFEAMRAKNADAIRALFTAEGQLVAIDKPRSGQGISTRRVLAADAFAKMISEAKGEFIEKMPEKDVKISGDFALVFGRYTFYVGEKFSHCGVNSFQLVKTESGWRIANIASTLEFDCGQTTK
jgi:imidazolonepropionase-like amidohydrolase